MRPIRPAIPPPLPPAGWAGVPPPAAHVAPLSPPCADARRGHEPSGTRRAVSCPHFPPGSTPRAVTAPLSHRVAHVSLRTPVTVCPPLRGSALPPTARRLSVSSLPPRPSCRMGCRPLCRLPLSPAPARSHLLPYGIAASASDSLCPRFPSPPCRMGYRLCLRLSVPSLPSLLLPDGLPPLSPTLCAVASLSPPAGWAAASVSDSLCRRFPLSSCRMGCCLCLRPPRSPPLCAVAAPSPHAGWDVVLGAAERAGRCYPRFGAGAAHLPRVSGAGGARRVDRGRGARPIRPSCGACEISRPRQPRATHHHIASVPLSPPLSRHDARRAAWWGIYKSPAKRIFVDEPQGQSAHSNAPQK